MQNVLPLNVPADTDEDEAGEVHAGECVGIACVDNVNIADADGLVVFGRANVSTISGCLFV